MNNRNKKFDLYTRNMSEEEKKALKNYAELLNMDIEDVANMMMKKELRLILAKHPYPISQGQDGRWRTYVKKEDGSRKQIARATEEKVHEALYDYYKSEASVSDNTLEVLFPKWIKYKEDHGAAKTYLLRLEKDFKNHYSEIAQIPVSKLTKLTLDNWACGVARNANRSKKQYDNITTIIRQLLDWAMDAGLVQVNVFRQVKINKKVFFDNERKKPSETQVFTEKEVLQIYDCAMRDFLNGRCTVHKLTPLAIMFMFLTGLRVGELCAIRYEDIDGNKLNVQRMFCYETNEIISHTKGYRQVRTVPLVSDAMKIIEQAEEYQKDNNLNVDGFVFSVNEKPLSYYSVKKLLRRYCDEIGTFNKSSHKARKTFISTLFEKGVSISRICDVVGHNDTRTTFKHYCFDREDRDTLVEQFENALYKNNKKQS